MATRLYTNVIGMQWVDITYEYIFVIMFFVKVREREGEEMGRGIGDGQGGRRMERGRERQGGERGKDYQHLQVNYSFLEVHILLGTCTCIYIPVQVSHW